MTERQEVRFNVYGKNNDIVSKGTGMKYDLIDFNVGGGSYSTSTYKYTVAVAGTYLIGYSYMKRYNTNPARMYLEVIRNGTTIRIEAKLITANSFGRSVSGSVIYKLEVDDILFVNSKFGNPAVNFTAYTSNDIKNSFWGIRLDY
jgi:hypothetical protein